MTAPLTEDEARMARAQARAHLASLPSERRAELEAEWAGEWIPTREHARRTRARLHKSWLSPLKGEN